ncbi:thioredoxin fold domain-containing protein [Alteromonas sp. 14N.309.X.WAT.G.H12]|uniref:thioredoxin fold domain-containing protein n=1 Tax=Alteromonas sp. 14N.309.X.WAT.G.H12 TaxID=3120824 RepID=UPI002FD4691E
MKFNGLMKKIAVATVLGASSITAMAGGLDGEAVDSALTKLSTHLTASGVGDLAKSIKTDFTLAPYQEKVDGESFPVLFADSYFLTTATGDGLIRPNAMYVSSGGKLVPASDILTPILIESSKGNWISHELPEGVAYAGDLYVVTDPTCGYCKMVEKELDHYLDQGIVVHYIPFPRSGIEGARKQQPGYQRWLQALCSDNPAVAYREITLGDTTTYADAVNKEGCSGDMIDSGYKLGRSIGVNGTPFMYLTTVDGKSTKVPGYKPYADILGDVGITISQ